MKNVVIPPCCKIIIYAFIVDFKQAPASDGIIEPLDSKFTE